MMMRWLLVVVAMMSLLMAGCGALPIGMMSDTGIYQERSIHHPDGIGKFYMGREIAQVMGHQGAAWLERSSRELEERPNLLITTLDLQPTDVVAGTGYFSFRLSRSIPDGKVLAIDVQPEMLEILDFLRRENQIENVEPILGTEDDPHLPSNQVDLALMVDAYHEFAYPKEMMEEIVQALKPNGRVVLAEYRGENPLIPIKGLHKMTQRQVKRELRSVGLEWEKTEEILPQQHLMFFRKPAGEDGRRKTEI
jgi:SAM-dependent methyltransferase